jgi:hypothetical protein
LPYLISFSLFFSRYFILSYLSSLSLFLVLLILKYHSSAHTVQQYVINGFRRFMGLPRTKLPIISKWHTLSPLILSSSSSSWNMHKANLFPMHWTLWFYSSYYISFFFFWPGWSWEEKLLRTLKQPRR